MRSRARCTYEEVHAVLAGKDQPYVRGRALVAHHSVLVVEVFGAISKVPAVIATIVAPWDVV